MDLNGDEDGKSKLVRLYERYFEASGI